MVRVESQKDTQKQDRAGSCCDLMITLWLSKWYAVCSEVLVKRDLRGRESSLEEVSYALATSTTSGVYIIKLRFLWDQDWSLSIDNDYFWKINIAKKWLFLFATFLYQVSDLWLSS